MKQIFCGLFFLISIPNSGLAFQESASIRVLFIGNSYTYYHSMPQMSRAMGEHHFPGQQIETAFVGHGGATLKQLWEEKRALEEIRYGQWNYVVLQEQSMLGGEIIEKGKSFLRSPGQFFNYARKFADAIQENGAEVIFYMTWSRKEYPDQQKYLTYAYMNIAEETGSKIAPAGMAWDELRTNIRFDLYEFGGSHPSIYGAYAAALMLFAIVFDVDPTGMPGRLEGKEILKGGDISDEKSILCDLAVHEIKIIQNTVSNIYQQVKKENGYIKVEKAVSNKEPSISTKLFHYFSDSRNQLMILLLIAGIVAVIKGSLFLFK